MNSSLYHRQQAAEATRIQPKPAHKIRVLHVVESFSTGVLQCIAFICHALRNEAVFMILHGNREEMPDNFRRYFPSETTFEPWLASREIDPRGDIRAMRQMSEAISRFQPDIIHAHSSKAGALCRLFNWRNTHSVIYSPHGYSFLRQDLSWMKRQFYRGIEHSLGRLPHLTVAVGVDELIEASRVARSRLLIPNMINVDELGRSRRHKRARGPLRVAMMGGIRPQKNFALFAEVASRFSKSDAVFTWIGGGDSPQSSIPANVHITGWLERNEALATLADCDVFMQTSLWEGLPLSVLEAMALALPVLGTPAAGNTELIIDGLNGYVCGCPDEFERRLRVLAGDPDLRRQYGDAGHDFVSRYHSSDAIAPRWSSVYGSYRRYASTPSLDAAIVR